MTDYAREVQYDPSGPVVPEWNRLQPSESAVYHSVDCAERLGVGVTVSSFVWSGDGLTVDGQVDDAAGVTNARLTPPDPLAVEPTRHKVSVKAITSDGQTIIAGQGVITVGIMA